MDLEKTMRTTQLEQDFILCVRNSEILTIPVLLELAYTQASKKSILHNEIKAILQILKRDT